ncbi:MAG TPA: sigma-70 family RNA polymerase sigma factor, partial [Gemmataceae bacterium]|nr:sigma-70 family RNA polymerase sigma factor [Gemmataceae bacterium]
MAASINQVLAQMQRWTAAAQLAELSDAVLLGRYIHQRDEAAFAALVARHGALVLHVCRQILGNAPEAEDAFQAAFLNLSRKARSLKQPEALPGWLHGVARRVALKARTKSLGRAARSEDATPLAEELADSRPDPLMQLTARELLDIVHEEVRHLPAAQQSAVILCCLEGHTREEAARILGCKAGSIKGHLQRGRQRLQKRLERHGISLSAVLALAVVSRSTASSVPPLLVQSTIKAALGGGIGSSAAALAQSVLQAMFLPKLAGAIVVTLTLALAASTTVVMVYRGLPVEVPEEKTPVVPVAPKNAGAGKPQVRTDAFGDPLPDGVLRRLGTLRFRHGGGNAICNLLLTPDGKTLVSNDYYGSRKVCVWELATGKLLHRLPGSYEAKNIALSPDGKLVAVGQEKAIILWNLVSGKEVRRLAQANASGFVFSPDGKILAAGGYDPAIHLWDLSTGKKITQFDWKRDRTSVTVLAFTPDGKTLIAGQKFHSKIGLWNVASGKQRRELDAKSGDIFTLALSPDGVLLATGSRKGGIPLWNVKTGELVGKLGKEGGRECYTVAFSPNGKILAAIERDAKNQDSLSLWDVAAGKELHRFNGDIGLWSIVYSRDGKTLIVASSGAIRLLDAATGKEVGPTAGSPGYVGFATMSPDGRTLAYLRQNDIQLWGMRTGREIGSIDAHNNGIRSLAIAPNGQTVAASGGEHDISLWDVKTRKLRRLQWDKKESPYDWSSEVVAFSPDGRMFASGDYLTSIVRIWDTNSGKQVRRLDFAEKAKELSTIENIAFSPDGKTLAVSGRGKVDNSKVRLWDVATGKQLTHLN